MTCGVGWPWVLRALGLEECSAAVESHRLPETSNGRDFLFCRDLSMAMAVAFGGDIGAHDPRGSRASTSPTLGR